MARNDEARLQAGIVHWIRNEVPGVLVAAVPNGAHVSSKAHGALLRWTGTLAGFPDLVVLWRGGFVMLEVKADKGRLSDSQQALFPQIAELGHQVHVVRSIEEVKALFARLGIQARAPVANLQFQGDPA